MYYTWCKTYMMNRRTVWEREEKRQREGKETERAILCLILKCISHPPYSNQISQLRPKTSDMMDECAAGTVGYFYLPHFSDFSASWQVCSQALFSFTWLYPHLRLQSTWFPLCYWTERQKRLHWMLSSWRRVAAHAQSSRASLISMWYVINDLALLTLCR